MHDVKPILAGTFGFIFQFTHVETFIKVAVGLLTIAYIGAKLVVVVANNRDVLLHPISYWFGKRNGNGNGNDNGNGGNGGK